MEFKRYYYLIFYNINYQDIRVFKQTTLKLKYLIEDEQTLELAKIKIAEQLKLHNVPLKKQIPLDAINIINFQYLETKCSIEYSDTDRYLYNVIIDCTNTIDKNDIKSTYVETDYNVSNFEEMKALRKAAINQIQEEYNITLNDNDCSMINYCFISQTSIEDENDENDENND